MYACSLGDVRVLFLEKGESRHATALRGARSRFEGPIGSNYNYPLYLGDVGHVSGTTSLRSPSCALRSV